MSLSYFGRAVSALCSLRNTTASAIAAQAGLSHVNLSRACNGTRMEAKTLRAIVTGQPDRRDGLDLLIGHLRDEIDRAGVTEHEVTISADGRLVEADFRLLAEEAARDPQLAALLRDMAALVRARPLQAQETQPLAADDPATYGGAAAAEARATIEALTRTPGKTASAKGPQPAAPEYPAGKKAPRK